VEHRLEKVAVKDGVTYINDSKATNVDACRVALEAVDAPIVLIVGGKDKGNDYSTISDLVKEKCSALVYLGADNSKLHASFDHLGLPVADTSSMADCVKACRKFATEGTTVLLSPCCASFDLFHNMEDRGEQFKARVKESI
jgi:UDP-N-acetylmuramoylalanine--D-glutamate ligase